MEKIYSSRQLQILISAINLIEEDGIQNLTIKNLAKRNCITDGAIYKHFKNKDEIINATLEMVRADILHLFNKAERYSDNPISMLAYHINCYASFFHKNPAYGIILLSETGRNEARQLKPFLKILMDEAKTIIQRIIQKGQQTHYFRNDIMSDHLALIYMSSLRFTLAKWYASEYEMDIQSECTKIWNSLRLLFSNKSD
ncbi:MAG: TetR/AcrR family transcriptional regulator [Bacteroidota bacterium]